MKLLLKNDLEVIDSAVAYAISNKSVVVFAAGNSGAAMLGYPASIAQSQDVITVGALSLDKKLKIRNGDQDWGSQYGAGLTIVAPGVFIYSIMSSSSNGERYQFLDGTSFSAPMVAGTVALMFAKNPALTPRMIKDKLVEHSNSVIDERLGGYEYRVLNICNVLDSISPDKVNIRPD